jgi:hypothetical protein
VGAIEYSFGGEMRLAVVELRAPLSAVGPLSLAGHTIAADATLEAIAGAQIPGCAPIEHLEGGSIVECRDGDVTVTLSRGGPRADAPLQVSLARTAGC